MFLEPVLCHQHMEVMLCCRNKPIPPGNRNIKRCKWSSRWSMSHLSRQTSVLLVVLVNFNKTQATPWTACITAWWQFGPIASCSFLHKQMSSSTEKRWKYNSFCIFDSILNLSLLLFCFVLSIVLCRKKELNYFFLMKHRLWWPAVAITRWTVLPYCCLLFAVH